MFLDNLECDGTEGRLIDCPPRPSQIDCDGTFGVGITCQGEIFLDVAINTLSHRCQLFIFMQILS